MRTTISHNTEAKEYLKSILNKSMRIEMSDDRTLIGIFLCTDKDSNIILGSCYEYAAKQIADYDRGISTISGSS